MATMCGLKTIPANAVIKVGNFTIKTPYILNININRSRGKMVSSASVAFTFDGKFNSTGGLPLVIYIYDSVVFTGVVKSLSISPSARCAGEIIVRIQGEDILYKLENRNITRRQKLAGLGPMAFISGLSTKRTSVGFDDPPSRYGIDSSSSPIEYLTHSTNPEEQTQIMKDHYGILGANHPTTRYADKISNGGTSTGGGGMTFHDHASMDLLGLGPAVGSFGIK